VDATAGHGPTLTGLVSAAFLQRVSGGQPLLLRRSGRLTAVLLDPDTYAELQAAIAELLDREAPA
jgi:PHD/YefM family antitoxin component YafN of YafNO toxin-antitoxin module